MFLIMSCLFFLNDSFHPELLAQELRENYLGVRPAGMGNATTSFSDDENSVWTNPAGIARVRKARSRHPFSLLTMPSIIVGGNAGGQKFIAKSTGKSLSAGAEVLEGILSEASSNQAQSIWVRVSNTMIGFFDAPRGSPWAVGLITNVMSKIRPEGSSSSVADAVTVVDSTTDVGGVLTMGWTNRSNRINFALQLRPTMRYGFYDKIPLADLLPKFKTKIKEESNNGLGIGADLGFIWTIADYWFPSIGVAVKNLPTGCIDNYLNAFEEKRQKVCGTKYGGTVNNQESPYLLDPTDVRVGLSISPRLGRKLTLRFSADLHHLYISPDNKTYYGLPGVEPIKNLHGGAELYFGNPLAVAPFSLRVGFNQGFSSFGGTLRLGSLVMEAAMIETDISSDPSGEKDQRFLANLSLQFY